MKIINKQTGETIAEIIANHGMTLDEACDIAGVKVKRTEEDYDRDISIHAPRGGSDSKSACFLCENLSIYHKFCTQIFLKAFPPLLST